MHSQIGTGVEEILLIQLFHDIFQTLAVGSCPLNDALIPRGVKIDSAAAVEEVDLEIFDPQRFIVAHGFGNILFHLGMGGIKNVHITMRFPEPFAFCFHGSAGDGALFHFVQTAPDAGNKVPFAHLFGELFQSAGEPVIGDLPPAGDILMAVSQIDLHVFESESRISCIDEVSDAVDLFCTDGETVAVP